MPSPPRTQQELEEIIWSRLVETFLTINLPQTNASEPPPQKRVQVHARSESSPNRGGVLGNLSSHRKIGSTTSIRRQVSTSGNSQSTITTTTK